MGNRSIAELHLIRIIDLSGELLGKAKMAKDAAHMIANICMLQIVSAVYCQVTGYKPEMDMIGSNLCLDNSAYDS